MHKENRTYYFSVEGATEKWYLDWLQNMINADPDAKYTVKLNSKIQKDPLAHVKKMTITGKTEVTHIFDYESEEAVHVQQFKTALDRMKEAQNSGKNIKYQLGYSNLTFELWIILHKEDCNRHLAHRNLYLDPLNRAYGEHFENLKQYKQEDNFKRILKQLSLNHVKAAIRRSKAIMQRNQENGYVLQQYKGYKYYRENPSLSIWKVVDKILFDCEILR